MIERQAERRRAVVVYLKSLHDKLFAAEDPQGVCQMLQSGHWPETPTTAWVDRMSGKSARTSRGRQTKIIREKETGRQKEERKKETEREKEERKSKRGEEGKKRRGRTKGRRDE